MAAATAMLRVVDVSTREGPCISTYLLPVHMLSGWPRNKFALVNADRAERVYRTTLELQAVGLSSTNARQVAKIVRGTCQAHKPVCMSSCRESLDTDTMHIVFVHIN